MKAASTRANLAPSAIPNNAAISTEPNGEATTVAGPSEGKKSIHSSVRPASVSDTLSFVFQCGKTTHLLFYTGIAFSICEGVSWPLLAHYLSRAYSGVLEGASEGMESVWRQVRIFLTFAAITFTVCTMQTICLEKVSRKASLRFRHQWFKALVRQDLAFFDVHGSNEVVASFEHNSELYRRGVGKKFGQILGSLMKAAVSLIWGLVSAWKLALVLMGVLPMVILVTILLIKTNQRKSIEASKAYKQAGKVALSTLTSIRTILSLNAAERQIDLYAAATYEAYKASAKRLWILGLANGGVSASAMALFMVITLFGSYLIYTDIEDTGCDPSMAVRGQKSCTPSGPDVFSLMFLMFFAADGLSGVSTCMEAFMEARVAAGAAIETMERKLGSKERTIYEEPEPRKADSIGMTSENGGVSRHSGTGALSNEKDIPKVKGILPEYAIDTSSPEGIKLANLEGRISFCNVSFSYPTRSQSKVLDNFSFDIPAGSVVAFVGRSGSGKSTLCALLERFYDPLEGSVCLDDIDIRTMNVPRLRQLIGYVGQEPTLFATTIAENIRYGNSQATQEEIEAAAKLCNAHDFIMSFPLGYETYVSDGGSHLSGGQKQRIAIARVLVANPSILLLDEATSALDNESERLVQQALDNVLSSRKRTTIVIAHRLSTIRNADLIAVLDNGKIVETGSHDELLLSKVGYYRNLVERQTNSPTSIIREPISDTVKAQTTSSPEDLSYSEDLSNDVLFEFKDVFFCYPSRPGSQILQGLTLTIKQGEILAICGPSGQGKSTIMALIERFYDAQGGSVQYRGHNVTSLNVRWYRDQIGYVGQEPTLFNDTIANNIAYGTNGAHRNDIEQAAHAANAHSFITGFPNGYDTIVGEKGSQLSGGQKQRIAIARSLIKSPKLLLFDEATSALDTESEALVQEALSRLLKTRQHTCVMIAHRLSTVRQADKIAYIGQGTVKEYGSHEELMALRGHYFSLVTATPIDANESIKTTVSLREESTNGENVVEQVIEQKSLKTRAWELAAPDLPFIFWGFVGAFLGGSVYPMAGVLYGTVVELFLRPVQACSSDSVPNGFNTCDEFLLDITSSFRDDSFKTAGFWALNALCAILGNLIAFTGFGRASERLMKRLRDATFTALVRQECAFFDEHRVGDLTSQLQKDTSLLHNYVGEPIRSFTIAISAIVVGLGMSLYFMWPFALVSILFVPLVGFARVLYARQHWGIDEGETSSQEGGVVLETLGNMKTISALTLEEQKIRDFICATELSEINSTREILALGIVDGYQISAARLVNAIQFGWGGWLIFNFPEKYEYSDFLNANFAMIFATLGLGVAFSDLGDRKETDAAIARVLAILDRHSSIDPLAEDGKILDEPS